MRRHPLVIATACYVLLALALTGPALVGRAALAPDSVLDSDPLYRIGPPPPMPRLRDYSGTVLDYPRDVAFARGLRAGRVDLWNPLAAAGAPLWADQGGPFFPLKVLFYLAPSRETYNLYLALRLAASAIGAYLLARSRGQAPFPALAAGATFEVSGAMLTPMAFGNTSPVYVLPWVILGSFLIARRRSLSSATGAGIVLGISANGGHPTLIFMVFAAFAAATAGHMLAAWRRPREVLCTAGYAVLAVTLGLGLGAVSLLPLAELANLGSSYKNQPIGETTRLSGVAWSRAALRASLFASRWLGTLPTVNTVADLSPSIGTVALLAAVTGVLSGRVHCALLTVALLGIALTLAPPGLNAIALLPGLRHVQPIYGWPLIALSSTQAAGDGLGALATSRLLQPARLGTIAATALAAVMIAEQLSTVAPHTLHPASAVVGGQPSPVVEFLKGRLASGDSRFAGIPHLVGYPLSPTLFGLADLRNLSALPVARYLDYVQALNLSRHHFTIQSVPRRRSPLLDLAAVRYLVLPAPVGVKPAETKPGSAVPMRGLGQRPVESDPAVVRVYADEHALVYENLAALPRVRLAHRAERVADAAAARSWAQALAKREETARALGLADTLVVEPDEHGNQAPAPAGAESEAESVRILDREDPDRLVIEAEVRSNGFVVIADTYYPGWNAWVDGVRTPIHPANLLFRAVPVAAGAHTIELRYQPASVLYGAVLSALSALACLLVFLSRRQAGRRRWG